MSRWLQAAQKAFQQRTKPTKLTKPVSKEVLPEKSVLPGAAIKAVSQMQLQDDFYKSLRECLPSRNCDRDSSLPKAEAGQLGNMSGSTSQPFSRDCDYRIAQVFEAYQELEAHDPDAWR